MGMVAGEVEDADGGVKADNIGAIAAAGADCAPPY